MDYGKNLDLKDIKYFCEFDLVWKTEEWKDIVSFENKYQISDLGRIKSLSRNRLSKSKNRFKTKSFILKQGMGTNGYLQICLSNINKKITKKTHQLVAIAFLNHTPCGYKLVINHKNFIRTDNRKLNLEITTARENSNLLHIKSSSKYTGVTWDKQMKKWRAKITIGYKQIFLGLYINEIDAHNAYQEALANIT